MHEVKPIATTSGICFAFPDVRRTPTPGGPTPVPYPNTAQLSDASGTAKNVNAGGKPVILESSSITPSTGGEAGTGGGVNQPGGPCRFAAASQTVRANGTGIVRQGDATDQNGGNAKGTVMVGLPTVLVGD